MTTCDYCKREYATAPEECVGCGAPLAGNGPLYVFDVTQISPKVLMCSGLKAGHWIPLVGDGNPRNAIWRVA